MYEFYALITVVRNASDNFFFYMMTRLFHRVVFICLAYFAQDLYSLVSAPLLDELPEEMFGAGPLEKLLADDEVSDILVKKSLRLSSCRVT